MITLITCGGIRGEQRRVSTGEMAERQNDELGEDHFFTKRDASRTRMTNGQRFDLESGSE